MKKISPVKHKGKEGYVLVDIKKLLMIQEKYLYSLVLLLISIGLNTKIYIIIILSIYLLTIISIILLEIYILIIKRLHL